MDSLTCKGVQMISSIGKIRRLSVGVLTKLIQITCKDLRIQPGKICDGIGLLFAPPVKFILENTKLSGKEIAATFLGKKCYNSKDLAKYESLNWKVYIPPYPKSSHSNESPREESSNGMNSKFTSSNEASFKFAHFSDVHLDLEYSTGSEVNCNEPVCCRENDGDVAKGQKSMKARKWGEIDGSCDVPIDLAQEVFKHMGQVVKSSNGSVKYAVWSGKF